MSRPIRSVRSRRGGATLEGFDEVKLDAARLPREASPAEVAEDGQYDKNDDEDPEPAHVSPFVGGFATLFPLGSILQRVGYGLSRRNWTRGEAVVETAPRGTVGGGESWRCSVRPELEPSSSPCLE